MSNFWYPIFASIIETKVSNAYKQCPAFGHEQITYIEQVGIDPKDYLRDPLLFSTKHNSTVYVVQTISYTENGQDLYKEHTFIVPPGEPSDCISDYQIRWDDSVHAHRITNVQTRVATDTGCYGGYLFSQALASAQRSRALPYVNGVPTDEAVSTQKAKHCNEDMVKALLRTPHFIWADEFDEVEHEEARSTISATKEEIVEHIIEVLQHDSSAGTTPTTGRSLDMRIPSTAASSCSSSEVDNDDNKDDDEKTPKDGLVHAEQSDSSLVKRPCCPSAEDDRIDHVNDDENDNDYNEAAANVVIAVSSHIASAEDEGRRRVSALDLDHERYDIESLLPAPQANYAPLDLAHYKDIGLSRQEFIALPRYSLKLSEKLTIDEDGKIISKYPRIDLEALFGSSAWDDDESGWKIEDGETSLHRRGLESAGLGSSLYTVTETEAMMKTSKSGPLKPDDSMETVLEEEEIVKSSTRPKVVLPPTPELQQGSTEDEPEPSEGLYEYTQICIETNCGRTVKSFSLKDLRTLFPGLQDWEIRESQAKEVPIDLIDRANYKWSYLEMKPQVMTEFQGQMQLGEADRSVDWFWREDPFGKVELSNVRSQLARGAKKEAVDQPKPKVHHLNYEGKPVYHPTYTPKQDSVWAIARMKTFPEINIPDTYNDSTFTRIRQFVLIQQAKLTVNIEYNAMPLSTFPRGCKGFGKDEEGGRIYRPQTSRMMHNEVTEHESQPFGEQSEPSPAHDDSKILDSQTESEARLEDEFFHSSENAQENRGVPSNPDCGDNTKPKAQPVPSLEAKDEDDWTDDVPKKHQEDANDDEQNGMEASEDKAPKITQDAEEDWSTERAIPGLTLLNASIPSTHLQNDPQFESLEAEGSKSEVQEPEPEPSQEQVEDDIDFDLYTAALADELAANPTGNEGQTYIEADIGNKLVEEGSRATVADTPTNVEDDNDDNDDDTASDASTEIEINTGSLVPFASRNFHENDNEGRASDVSTAMVIHTPNPHLLSSMQTATIESRRRLLLKTEEYDLDYVRPSTGSGFPLMIEASGTRRQILPVVSRKLVRLQELHLRRPESSTGAGMPLSIEGSSPRLLILPANPQKVVRSTESEINQSSSSTESVIPLAIENPIPSQDIRCFEPLEEMTSEHLEQWTENVNARSDAVIETVSDGNRILSVMAAEDTEDMESLDSSTKIQPSPTARTNRQSLLHPSPPSEPYYINQLSTNMRQRVGDLGIDAATMLWEVAREWSFMDLVALVT
ncbi:MAG: hypothetical protein M1827_002305 [Pycnora praestabilis]|nr:MAG: hypothetical protein M1827_002305 [Pycnora praestabilis]